MDPYLAPAWNIIDVLGDGPRVPPGEFRIFSAGQVTTEKGEFVFDAKARASVMEAWGRRSVDLTMDYEHQALHDPPIEAPLSCMRWVPQIRNDELWATECKWTDRARNYLASGEYRYFSPAFSFDEESRRIKEVLNVALTNIPAMRGITPLVAASHRDTNGKEPGMDFEKLYNELKAAHEQLTAKLSALEATNADLTAKLGVASGTQTEAVQETAAITATLSLPATARAADRSNALTALTHLRTNVRAFTGANDDASAIGIIHSWKQDAGRIVALTARVSELEQDGMVKEFDGVLDDASRAGKLEPAERTGLRTAALNVTGGRVTKEGIAFLRASLGARKAGPAGSGSVQPPKVEGPGALDPLQLHIAKICGRDLTAPPTTPVQK